MSKISLDMIRENDVYTARILVPGQKDAVVISKVTFREAMERVSAILLERPDATLEVKMNGSSSTQQLPEGFEDVLRHDFETAMEILHPAPVIVKVREKPKTLSIGIRYGYDTLADTVGDVVYISRRDVRVESPITGRWVEPADLKYLDLTLVNGSWATVSSDLLVQSGEKKFWLPRLWNPSRGWIQRNKFIELLSTYKKDKEACLAKQVV